MGIFLETKRLILKRLEPSDFDRLLALRSDVEVMCYTGEGGPQTEEQVQQYLKFSLAYQEKHGLGFCTVFEKETEQFIGEAGLFHLLFDDSQTDMEINYHLNKKFWGKEYATEIVQSLLQWGFEHLSIPKIVATSYPENIASQKVLQKNGFVFKFTKRLPNELEIRWYEIEKV